MPLRLGVAGLVAICVAAGLIGARSDAVAGAGAQRPNVVVVMSDDQDTDSMRVMKQTQRLLVRQGVSFTRHYATFPLCCPSRAAYLTGQYAHNSGVTGSRAPTLPCASVSISSACCSRSARPAARFTAVVVFPVPPF